MFQLLLAALPFAVVVTNGEGRLVFINDLTEETFGYGRNELLGQSIEILVPDRFRKTHVGQRTDYMVKPRTRLMGSDLALSGRRKNGIEFPVEISLCPVSVGDEVFVTAILKDITVRKQTEQALRDTTALSENLLHTANVMIVMLDPDGCVTRLNQTAERVTGYTQADLQGKKWFEILVPKNKYPYVWEEFNRLLSGGPPKTFENPILTKSGEERHIIWQNNDLKMRGKIVGTISFGNDITERKRMEEALQESERRFRHLAREQERQLILSERLISFGELTASIAHEFNNPLGIVIGFAQDLLTEVDPADFRYQSVKIIEEEARRCKKIMQDLLDFGRQTPPQFTQVNPAEIIRKSIDLLAGRFQKARVRPVILDSNGLPKVWVDSQQMGQVMVNLFLNAIEAMPDGGTLTVGMTAQPVSAGKGQDGPAGEDEVVIAVTDTGCGIDPDQLSKIFDPFFTTKTKKGMGLGLSICKSIMRAHGGEISAESLAGRGTTFSLHLPVERRRSQRIESIAS
jgi:hypothetical protein